MNAPAPITRKRLLRHKGRSGGDSDPFAKLPVEVLRSEACRTLPHPAHRVLVMLAAQYNGHGNGSLSLTRKTAAEFGLVDPYTLGASLRELDTRGLILQTRIGTRIPPRSALFALGWLRIDEPLREDPHELKSTLMAPDAWRRWAPSTKGLHWTTPRRAAMYHGATSASSTGLQGNPPISSTGLQGTPPKSVARGYYSQIYTRGRKSWPTC